MNRGTNYLEAALTRTTRKSTLRKHYNEYVGTFNTMVNALPHAKLPDMLSYQEFINYYKRGDGLNA